MTTLVRICLVLCALARYSYCLEEPNHTIVPIGDSCSRDYQCPEYAFCYYQSTCRCDPDYLSSLDKSMCIATVGMKCKNDLICKTMGNAECKQDLCACKDDFFLDSTNASNCISRPVNIGDHCQITTLCQEVFDLAVCLNEKCQCLTGHHFTNETKTCILSRGLYNTCERDYECYLDDKSPDVLECKNDQCVCKEGEPLCAKGPPPIAATGALVIILLLLQQRVA